MIRYRAYKISDGVARQARGLGVYGDTKARLQRMLKRAAMFTSPAGNRRFQNFAFMVEGDVVKWVARLDYDAEAA